MLCPFKTGRAGGRGKSNKVTRVTAKKGTYICRKKFLKIKNAPICESRKSCYFVTLARNPFIYAEKSVTSALLPGVTFNEFCNFKEETMTEQQKLDEYERYKKYLYMQSLSDKEYEQKIKAKAEELKI